MPSPIRGSLSRPRVLHYLNQVDIGGTVKTCLLLVKHLDKGAFNVWFGYKDGITKGMPPAHVHRLEQFADICGDRMVPIPEGGFGQALQFIKPDIIHLYRAGLPEYPQPGGDFPMEAAKVVETNVFGHLDMSGGIDKTLFMSEWLMNGALYGHPNPGDRFDFLNNPVEAPIAGPTLDFTPPKNDDEIYLGRVGRPDNGIYDDISVQAAKLLKERGYNITFVALAPPPNMVADLEKLGVPCVPIDPTSNPEVLSSVYSTIDIYCHARADGETFGVNIAEAMIHGKPVVTHVAVPKVPGMGVFQSQTALVDHGTTGFVVDPYSVEEYAKYVELLINNPSLRDEMGRAGFTKAYKEYSVYPVIKKLESVYRELVDYSEEIVPEEEQG